MAIMDYSFIQFRFINEDAPEKEDDVLEIKRNSEEFIWVYREHKQKTAQYTEYKDGAATLQALEGFLHLLSWDTDPYEAIQVIAPGFPMVMLGLKDIAQSWAVLRPFLERIFENWPLNILPEDLEDLDDDQANPALEADCCDVKPRDVLSTNDEDEEDEEDDENDDYGDEDGEGYAKVEEGEIVEDDDKTDPDMPPLVAPDDDLSDEALLRLKRRLWVERVKREWGGEGSPWTNPLPRSPEGEDMRQPSWLEAAEERQRTEPITVRRVTMTPNGPRTHLRFV
jgi:hypothetical protein